MAPRRALVIGGSLAGLFSANLLRAAGWDVWVFERSAADLSGRGAGLGTRAELFAVLRRMGIGLDGSLGAEVRSRLALDRDGTVLRELPIRSVTTAWDHVYRALRHALPARCYRAGMKLEHVQCGARRSVARFVDGTRAEGDLLVAADGMHSTARAAIAPEARPRYAGYVSWRGVVPESAVHAPFRETLSRHMTFCFPDGELAISVPLPAAPAGQAGAERRTQFSWFRPVEYPAGLRRLCTDASGRCHGESIPPTLIRPELLSDLKTSAAAALAPQLASLVAASRQIILQPIFDLESPRMASGRVVLVGDAAFAARPHVGTGVTKAALDAQCLADALHAAEGDVEAALEHYQRERLPVGRDLVARGRYLGAYLEKAGKAPREPLVLMREFGSAGAIAASKLMAWRT